MADGIKNTLRVRGMVVGDRNNHFIITAEYPCPAATLLGLLYPNLGKGLGLPIQTNAAQYLTPAKG